MTRPQRTLHQLFMLVTAHYQTRPPTSGRCWMPRPVHHVLDNKALSWRCPYLPRRWAGCGTDRRHHAGTRRPHGHPVLTLTFHANIHGLWLVCERVMRIAVHPVANQD